MNGKMKIGRPGVAAPPGPPASRGGCAPRTPCNLWGAPPLKLPDIYGIWNVDPDFLYFWRQTVGQILIFLTLGVKPLAKIWLCWLLGSNCQTKFDFFDLRGQTVGQILTCGVKSVIKIRCLRGGANPSLIRGLSVAYPSLIRRLFVAYPSLVRRLTVAYSWLILPYPSLTCCLSVDSLFLIRLSVAYRNVKTKKWCQNKAP